MSVSAIFGTRLVAPPQTATIPTSKAPPSLSFNGGGGLVVECSSRPQKKATAHHKKTRPRKTQKWDIKRGPTVYAPLPPLPPEWTLLAQQNSAGGEADMVQQDKS
ncbi:hypothetical protein Leryth_015628 [Lithospermum erythrorhizon]|nr:hypothetical protein Leryth_015628 [Lithospermum erythrorhizon]